MMVMKSSSILALIIMVLAIYNYVKHNFLVAVFTVKQKNIATLIMMK